MKLRIQIERTWIKLSPWCAWTKVGDRPVYGYGETPAEAKDALKRHVQEILDQEPITDEIEVER